MTLHGKMQAFRLIFALTIGRRRRDTGAVAEFRLALNRNRLTMDARIRPSVRVKLDTNMPCPRELAEYKPVSNHLPEPHCGSARIQGR